MNHLIIILCIVCLVSSASVPLRFVTSAAEKPTSLIDDVVNSTNSREPGKKLPSSVIVASKPHVVLDAVDGEFESDASSEKALTAWKIWLSTQNRSKFNPNPNEKTFTQQQIMEKLFNDYHKHLKEQSNLKPPGFHSPWPLDTEPEDPKKPSVRPSDAMSGFKYVQYQQNQQQPPQHHYGHDSPKDGWVSLEPIPWSVSKISKWTPTKVSGSNHQSQFTNKPGWTDRPQSSSAWSGNRPSDNRPPWNDPPAHWQEPANQPAWTNVPVNSQFGTNKPPWSDISKPQWGSQTTAKPWIDNKPSWSDLNRPSVSRPPWGRPTETINHHLGIITDGKPPEWPSDPPAHKPQQQYPGSWNRPQKGDWSARPPHYPPPMPYAEHYVDDDDDKKTASTSVAAAPAAGGDGGKWVLLSSTRGYTVPPMTADRANANRAFKFSASPNNMASSISTNREVDKSFETVDAEAAAAQMQSTTVKTPLSIKIHKRKPNKKIRPAKQQQVNATMVSSGAPVTVFTSGPASQKELQNRNRALIAAIGAGMLPATMAALVPMFLGKRRRRRRDVISDMLERIQPARSTFNIRQRNFDK